MASFLSLPAAAATTALLLFLSLSLSLSLSHPTPVSSSKTLQLIKSGRTLLFFNDEDLDSPVSKSKTPPKKKLISESLETKNKTKLLKPKKTNSTISFSSTTFSTTTTMSKLNKTLSSATKSKLNKTLTAIPAPRKSMLNKTAIAGTKTNTTKLLKPIKPLKSNSTKIAFAKFNSTKIQQPKSPNLSVPKTQKNPETKEIKSTPKTKKPNAPPANWLDDTHITGIGDDLISEFRELPSRLHSALVPDLEKLSTTSKLYMSKTHREIAAGVKPFVGKKYAPSIASAASVALLVLPLLLITALFRQLIRTGSSASLHRGLLFVQAYLAIYFATLSLTAVVAGLEPLWFFYAASPRSYAWTQAVQTLGYVVYLIAQLIAMVVAFSASEGEGATGKAIGLAQMLLGLAVGMHYYITVFHRAVIGEAPRANWKVHGIYAACFVAICGLGRAERRKKAYLQDDGGDDGKKS